MKITLVGFGSADERDFYQVDEKIQRIWLHAGHSNKRSGPIEIWRRASALRRLVRRLNPDVAVGFMHSAYVPLVLALAGTRIPVVASEHILFDHYRAFPLEALALRVTAPLYERITVISEAIRGSCPNGLASRMEVVPNPVLPADREFGSRERRSNIVLNVGRLFAQKDQRSLIEAFALVAETHPGWTLRIVGEGPFAPMLETLIVQLGLEDRVELPVRACWISPPDPRRSKSPCLRSTKASVWRPLKRSRTACLALPIAQVPTNLSMTGSTDCW